MRFELLSPAAISLAFVSASRLVFINFKSIISINHVVCLNNTIIIILRYPINIQSWSISISWFRIRRRIVDCGCYITEFHSSGLGMYSMSCSGIKLVSLDVVAKSLRREIFKAVRTEYTVVDSRRGILCFIWFWFCKPCKVQLVRHVVAESNMHLCIRSVEDWHYKILTLTTIVVNRPEKVGVVSCCCHEYYTSKLNPHHYCCESDRNRWIPLGIEFGRVQYVSKSMPKLEGWGALW